MPWAGMVLEHPDGFGAPLFSLGTLSVQRCSFSLNGRARMLPSQGTDFPAALLLPG